METTSYSPQKRGTFLVAAGLFFTAPLVAEFLLGIFPLKMLPALIVLAPMYGGAALLIRETVRRTERGWLSIAILGLVYGLIEEGFATQSLFNPNYLSMNMHLLQPAYIPQFGIGGLWTVYVLTLHVAWSIATPIALTEGLVPEKAGEPWLGRAGIVIAALLFIVGVAGVALISYKKDHFISSPMQFISTAMLCVALGIVAVRLPRSRVASMHGWAPGPWLAGAIALAAGSAILVMPHTWNWGAVLAIVAIDLAICGLALLWGRRKGWGLSHRLALAAGAAWAYAWHSFLQGSVTGSSSLSMKISHTTFALGAVALIAAAALRTTAYRTQVQLEADEEMRFSIR